MSEKTTMDVEIARAKPNLRVLFAVLLFLFELAIIGVVFKHVVAFDCRANWPDWACSTASGALVATYCMLGALILLVMLRPTPFLALFSGAAQRIWPLAVNGVGLGIAMAPVLVLKDGVGQSALVPVGLAWGFGMLALGVGLCLYLAPVER